MPGIRDTQDNFSLSPNHSALHIVSIKYMDCVDQHFLLQLRHMQAAEAYQGLNLELHHFVPFPVSCGVLCQLLLQLSLQSPNRI